MPRVLRDASALRASRVQLIDAESKYRHLTSGWAMLGRRAAAQAPATSPAPGHARDSLRHGGEGAAARRYSRAGMAAGDCSQGSAPLRAASPPLSAPLAPPLPAQPRPPGSLSWAAAAPRPAAPPRGGGSWGQGSPEGQGCTGELRIPPLRPGLAARQAWACDTGEGHRYPCVDGTGRGTQSPGSRGVCGCLRSRDLTDLVEIRRGDSRGTTGSRSWDPPKPRSGYRRWLRVCGANPVQRTAVLARENLPLASNRVFSFAKILLVR